MCLASLATSTICCAGEAFCSCVCLPFKVIGVLPANFSKLAYVIFQALWIIIAYLVCFAGTWLITWGLSGGFDCPQQSGDGSACFSASGLVRMSFSLAIFQLLILLVTLFKNDKAAIIHDGWWTLKFIVVAALFTTSFFIPNAPVIDYYLIGAKFVSVAYLKY